MMTVLAVGAAKSRASHTLCAPTSLTTMSSGPSAARRAAMTSGGASGAVASSDGPLAPFVRGADQSVRSATPSASSDNDWSSSPTTSTEGW